jgi:hypothetical protein
MRIIRSFVINFLLLKAISTLYFKCDLKIFLRMFVNAIAASFLHVELATPMYVRRIL